MTSRNNVFSVCKDRRSLLIFLQTIASQCYSSITETFTYTVNGKPICPTAFQDFWNIKEYTRRKIEASIRNNISLDVPHGIYFHHSLSDVLGNSFLEHPDTKTTMCRAWMLNFCNYQEQQPDSPKIHCIERILKCEVWLEMCEDMLLTHPNLQKSELPSFPLFCRVWRQYFTHLKIPKVNQLGKCNECVTFLEKIKKATGRDRDNLLRKKRVHIMRCKKERVEMQRLHERAKEDPENWTRYNSVFTKKFFLLFLGDFAKQYIFFKLLKKLCIHFYQYHYQLL